MGYSIDAKKAYDWGLVLDVLADETLLEVSKSFARDIAQKSSYVIHQNCKSLGSYQVSSAESIQLQNQFFESVNRQESKEKIFRYHDLLKRKNQRLAEE